MVSKLLFEIKKIDKPPARLIKLIIEDLNKLQ